MRSRSLKPHFFHPRTKQMTLNRISVGTSVMWWLKQRELSRVMSSILYLPGSWAAAPKLCCSDEAWCLLELVCDHPYPYYTWRKRLARCYHPLLLKDNISHRVAYQPVYSLQRVCVFAADLWSAFVLFELALSLLSSRPGLGQVVRQPLCFYISERFSSKVYHIMFDIQTIWYVFFFFCVFIFHYLSSVSWIV